MSPHSNRTVTKTELIPEVGYSVTGMTVLLFGGYELWDFGLKTGLRAVLIEAQKTVVLR